MPPRPGRAPSQKRGLPAVGGPTRFAAGRKSQGKLASLQGHIQQSLTCYLQLNEAWKTH